MTTIGHVDTNWKSVWIPHPGKKRRGLGTAEKTGDFGNPGNYGNLLWVGSSLALEHTNLMTTTLLNGQPVEAVQPDLQEVDEWLEAFDQVVDAEGPSGAARLLDALHLRAMLTRRVGLGQLTSPSVIPISS